MNASDLVPRPIYCSSTHIPPEAMRYRTDTNKNLKICFIGHKQNKGGSTPFVLPPSLQLLRPDTSQVKSSSTMQGKNINFCALSYKIVARAFQKAIEHKQIGFIKQIIICQDIGHFYTTKQPKIINQPFTA